MNETVAGTILFLSVPRRAERQAPWGWGPDERGLYSNGSEQRGLGAGPGKGPGGPCLLAPRWADLSGRAPLTLHSLRHTNGRGPTPHARHGRLHGSSCKFPHISSVSTTGCSKDSCRRYFSCPLPRKQRDIKTNLISIPFHFLEIKFYSSWVRG